MKRRKVYSSIIVFIAGFTMLVCVSAYTENYALRILEYRGKKAVQSLSDLKVYPNPFKAKLGHKKITFDGFSSVTTIRIYNATGKLIWEKKNLNLKYEWYVNNLSSQKVASGIYIYVVTSSDGVAKGKIAILR